MSYGAWPVGDIMDEVVKTYLEHPRKSSNGVCHPLLDNKIQYSDKFHLSKVGSISFVKHFRTTILDLMSKKI